MKVLKIILGFILGLSAALPIFFVTNEISFVSTTTFLAGVIIVGLVFSTIFYAKKRNLTLAFLVGLLIGATGVIIVIREIFTYRYF